MTMLALNAISEDNGESWSYATKTAIPNTASVELLVLKDGRWAFVGNDIADGRYRLVLMLSDDEGETWKWKEYLENDPKMEDVILIHASFKPKTKCCILPILHTLAAPKKRLNML